MVTYSTGYMARAVGIHPNTVRLYEKYGLLSSVPRDALGYRVYSERHLLELKVARSIFSHPWIGRELRRASLEVLEVLKVGELHLAYTCAGHYLSLLQKEYDTAVCTAQILKDWAEQRPRDLRASINYNRRQAAVLIGVTPEALRNWERNMLIDVPRLDANGARVYGHKEIERLRIIYMLRQSQYSMSAIARSLAQYDLGHTASVLDALHNPSRQDDLAWVLAGDRWLQALSENIAGAQNVLELIDENITKQSEK